MARKQVEKSEEMPEAVKAEPKPKFGYVKNKAGAIQVVDLEDKDILETLKDVGFVPPTKEDLDAYFKSRGNQIAGKPRIQGE